MYSNSPPLPRLKPYLKKLTYSYTFGPHPTFELFKYHKDLVSKVLFHSKYEQSEGVEEILAMCDEGKVPYEVNDHAIEKIAFKENTYLIGIFNKFTPEISADKTHIVLDQPRNMGNMGTIIRTMVAFGLHDLVMIGNSADIFDPKVVRSSMGAFFQINFQHYASFDEYIAAHPGRESYSLMLRADALQLPQLEIGDRSKLSLVFGNEGSGLPESYIGNTTPLYIPQKGEIDSLNLSVSVAVTLWEIFGRV